MRACTVKGLACATQVDFFFDTDFLDLMREPLTSVCCSRGKGRRYLPRAPTRCSCIREYLKNIWRGQSACTYTPLEDVSSVALKMERGGSGWLTPERSTSSSENGGKCLLIKRAGLLLGYKYRGLADFYLMKATRDVTYKYICLGQATDIKADVTAALWIHCCRTSASADPHPHPHPRTLAIVLKKE